MSGETKLSVMCSLFNWIQKSKSSTKKRSKFRKFLDTYCKPTDYFAAVRLILPNLDRERGSYGLKESVLATCIIDALGMSRESPDALRLINWRKGGAKTGVNAGNFSLVASEVLQRRQGMISGGLTIKELNDLLDRLASSENRTEKISVLSDLIKKTNAQEMKWIIMIILKDLKLGISEKSIFHEFHPDAEDLFNVTCDLKLVCERLRDRSQRHKRQDIEVGKAVRPQLALRVANAASAWKKLHGKEVVIECKFDGDRIQIHKNGEDIHFFSRNFLDHPEYMHGMSNIIIQNVLVDRCILDGEMLVWDTSNERFAEFGSNQEIAKAAKEGLASERQVTFCHIWHLVVMSFPGFNLDCDTIVKSFSASEKRLLRNKNLHIVDCKWLEDCFEKDLMMQEEEYNLRPAGFTFTESTSSDEHKLEPETFSNLKNEEKDEKKNTVNNLEEPTSDKKDGRKRERPINTKTSTRGRTGLNQRQRTRARSGKKAVKIHEYISDDDDEVSVDEIHVKDDEKNRHEMPDAIIEDSEVVEKAIDVSPNAKVTEEYSGKMADDVDSNKESDKLEVMVDPVQAMLLDMIPSLEPKTENRAIVDPPVPKRENPTIDPNPGPSKKKKVSYKDLAMELLKD